MSVTLEPLRAGDPRGVGRYRFLGRLGAGGMGLVCLGKSPEGRLVAVKLIHEDIAADPDYRRRFAREVRAASRIVGRFTAALVDADPDAPQPWYAAQYIEGPTLGQVVRQSGPLDERALRALAAGLADAVAAIEAAELVHRDIKPDNILLAADGPKVIDFGIARGENDSLLTNAGSVLGSPGYMSPEQVSGERATTASDVFSLGAVLTFAGQGVGPFGDGPAQARMYMTKYGEADCSGVPGGIRPVILRCLAKEPAARPTPRELVGRWSLRLDELDTLIQVGTRVAAESGAPQVVATPTPTPTPGTPVEVARPVGERMYGAGDVVLQPRPLPAQPIATPEPERTAREPEPERTAREPEPDSTVVASASDLDLAEDATSAEPWLPSTEAAAPPHPSSEAAAAPRPDAEASPLSGTEAGAPSRPGTKASAPPYLGTEAEARPEDQAAAAWLAKPSQSQPPPQPQLWFPGADAPSLAIPADPRALGRLDSRLPTMAAADDLAAPPPHLNPFVAREWTAERPPLSKPKPQRGPAPWWRQPVAVDLVPGGVVRDLLVAVAAAGALAAFSLPHPNVATQIAFAATALAIGFLAGVHHGTLAVAAYAAAALAGVKILPGKVAASTHDPTLGLLLDVGVLVLAAAAAARVGGLAKRPILGFAAAFAAYVAGQAAFVEWVARQAHEPFLTVWRASTNGLLIYRDGGIAAVSATAFAFLLLWVLARRSA